MLPETHSAGAVTTHLHATLRTETRNITSRAMPYGQHTTCSPWFAFPSDPRIYKKTNASRHRHIHEIVKFHAQPQRNTGDLRGSQDHGTRRGMLRTLPPFKQFPQLHFTTLAGSRPAYSVFGSSHFRDAKNCVSKWIPNGNGGGGGTLPTVTSNWPCVIRSDRNCVRYRLNDEMFKTII
jgi:hypothetical protein